MASQCEIGGLAHQSVQPHENTILGRQQGRTASSVHAPHASSHPPAVQQLQPLQHILLRLHLQLLRRSHAPLQQLYGIGDEVVSGGVARGQGQAAFVCSERAWTVHLILAQCALKHHSIQPQSRQAD